jgi:sugar/nucleoside kinase (ribokinase family)
LDVVAVGELNPDLILGGMTRFPKLGREILAERCVFTLGSSTALCAANLAALGLSVRIVGKVGDDTFGEFVIESLRGRRIDTSHVIRNEAREDHPGFSVEAVDPTGAGDAFNAGFLFGYLTGRPLAECATWANACGAMTVGQSGGSGAFEGRSDVEAFIRSKRGIGDRGLGTGD